MKIKKNLFEEQFNTVASNEGIDLQKVYESGFSKLITFMPGADYNDDLRVKKLCLNIPYRKHIITVEYNVGDAQTAHFSCELKNGKEIENFRINSRSQYSRLLFKKNILKVSTTNEKLKRFLENKLKEDNLEQIARNSLFTPKIEWNILNSNELKTHFSLSFEDKKEVLEPMIKFYKEFINLTLNYKTIANNL